MSRAAGIHFLLATQRVTSDVLPSMITANCPVQLGLRCRNEQESRNAIGEVGLEKISVEMVGRGVAVSHVKQEFQSFWITDEVIEKICDKHTLKTNIRASKEKSSKYTEIIDITLERAKNEEIEGVL